MSSVYFGGSRSFVPSSLPVASIVRAALESGASVHVGCQSGADQLVSFYALLRPSSLFVFAVASHHTQAPAHVIKAGAAGAHVVWSAGGQSAPIKARYLLRSIAAFQGCSAAVFFQPGSGSLAVAREAIKSGLPVFAFQAEPPAPVPSSAGHWVAGQFMGFACWQWQAVKQGSLF